MNRGGKRHSFDSVFVLLVFAVFAAASLLLVVVGADVYRGVVKDGDQNGALRASLTYVTNKVRANDTVGGITLRNVEGTDVLCMQAGSLGERKLVTYLYFYDGKLLEQYGFFDEGLSLGEGDVIVETQFFRMQQKTRLLIFTVPDGQGGEQSVSVRLRGALQ